MRGNPWGVHGLPGSHELHLLNSTLQHWKAGEAVDLPVFDKALRSGRGTAVAGAAAPLTSWSEGWFVGIRPMAGELDESEHSLLQPPLADDEQIARQAVQELCRTTCRLGSIGWTLAAAHAPMEFTGHLEAPTGAADAARAGRRLELQGSGRFHRMIATAILRRASTRSMPTFVLMWTERRVARVSPAFGTRCRLPRRLDRQSPERGRSARIADRHGIEPPLLPWLSRWRGADCAWPDVSSSERP